jgi:acyl-CoA synthetase (NDP forming)
MPNLNALLRARSIAIVGASANPTKFGWHVVHQLIEFGYAGRICPVNPGYLEIEGLPCYPDLNNTPGEIELAVICVGDEAAESTLIEVARCGVKAAVLFGSGAVLSESGKSASARLAAVARDADIALMGANCMGFYNFVDHLLVTGYPYHREPREGVISFITHSGSTLSAVAKNTRGMNFNYVISPGQELVLTAADYLRFVLEQPETRVVGLFLETIRDPDGFVAALALARDRAIPVVLLKVGRSERGAEMAMAHTGALAGRHAAIEAVAARYGVAMVRTLEEMLDTLELVAGGRRPTTRAMGAITDSGGERGMMVDLAADLRVPFAKLSCETLDTMTQHLDPGLTPANPADLWGSGREWQQSYRSCIAAMLADDAVGAFNFGIDFNVGSRLGPDYRDIAVEAFKSTAKPFAVVANVASGLNPDDARLLREAGVPVLEGAETGLLAFKHLFDLVATKCDDGATLESATELPDLSRQVMAIDGRLTELESFKLFSHYLPCVSTIAACTEHEAIEAAEKLGYPVVLKTAMPGIAHKSEVDGVILGVTSSDGVKAAYQSLSDRLGPEVLVQPLMDSSKGIELFMGMTVDEQFGPMVTVGLGGIWIETLRDSVSFLAPCSSAEAARGLQRLRGYELLQGARGKTPVNLVSLGNKIEVFSRFAVLARDSIAEADLNPVLVVGDQLTVLDALIVPKPPRPA